MTSSTFICPYTVYPMGRFIDAPEHECSKMTAVDHHKAVLRSLFRCGPSAKDVPADYNLQYEPFCNIAPEQDGAIHLSVLHQSVNYLPVYLQDKGNSFAGVDGSVLAEFMLHKLAERYLDMTRLSWVERRQIDVDELVAELLAESTVHKNVRPKQTRENKELVRALGIRLA